MKLTEELAQLKRELGIMQEVDCSEEENQEYLKLRRDNKPLPNGVLTRHRNGSIDALEFYRLQETSLAKEELFEYIQYKQLRTLITIKKCVVFFTVLTIISLIFGILTVLNFS